MSISFVSLKSLCVIILLAPRALSFPAVTFLEGPEDLYASVGENVQFNCTYSGTNELPYIVIDGEYKTATNLPPRHRFEFMQLFITDIQPSDNNTRYMCAFPSASSSVGHIRINSTGDLISSTTISHSNSWSASSEAAITTFSSMHFTTSTSLQFSATTFIILPPIKPERNNYLGAIVVGVLAVFATLSLGMATIAIAIVVYRRFCDGKTHARTTITTNRELICQG